MFEDTPIEEIPLLLSDGTLPEIMKLKQEYDLENKDMYALLMRGDVCLLGHMFAVRSPENRTDIALDKEKGDDVILTVNFRVPLKVYKIFVNNAYYRSVVLKKQEDVVLNELLPLH